MELTRINPPEGRRGVRTWGPAAHVLVGRLCPPLSVQEAPAETLFHLPATAIVTASRASNLHRL